MILNNFIENFNFNTSDSVIVKVIAYIKSNYSEDLKLETLGNILEKRLKSIQDYNLIHILII